MSRKTTLHVIEYLWIRGNWYRIRMYRRPEFQYTDYTWNISSRYLTYDSARDAATVGLTNIKIK